MLSTIFKSLSNNTSRILTPLDAYLYVKKLYESNNQSNKEHFYVVMLNKKNNLLGHGLIAVGDHKHAIIDQEKLEAFLDMHKPDQIIITHNHPSGKVNPSKDDLTFTRLLSALCSLKSINLVDHIIYSKYSYYSFLDNNLLSKRRHYASVQNQSIFNNSLLKAFSSTITLK